MKPLTTLTYSSWASKNLIFPPEHCSTQPKRFAKTLGRPPSSPAWVKKSNYMIKLVMVDIPFSKRTKCYPSFCGLVVGFEATGRNAHHGLRQEDLEGVFSRHQNDLRRGRDPGFDGTELPKPSCGHGDVTFPRATRAVPPFGSVSIRSSHQGNPPCRPF